MLEIIEYGKDEYAFPSLIVLGCFDAIHIGHRELFKKAKLQAKINGLDLGVMMFRDGKGGRQIYSFEERVAMLSAYNVKFVLVIDYTPEFKQIMPLDFLAAIEDKINVKAYMSGKDFRFGKGAKGKSSTLKNYAEDEENGVWYMPVKDVMSDGEKISTTLIKSCLDSGNVRRASELLGENFFVEGQVVEGAHRGTGILGFPTVNIHYPEWKYPVKHGVYKVAVEIDGSTYSGIANFGGRPTFGDDSEVLEVHIKDFEGDLYGKTVKVGFVGYMRSIRKFDSAQALADQLSQDKSALDLSEEQFFALYPLEEPVEAVEEHVTEQLAEDIQPPAEVFEGAPAVQPEAEVSAPVQEPEEEILTQDEVAESALAQDIVPAWKLLNEPVDCRITEFASAHVSDEVSAPAQLFEQTEEEGQVVETARAEQEEEEQPQPAEEVIGEIAQELSAQAVEQTTTRPEEQPAAVSDEEFPTVEEEELPATEGEELPAVEGEELPEAESEELPAVESAAEDGDGQEPVADSGEQITESSEDPESSENKEDND